jgi:Ribbon-helix-helix protein, copG family
MPGLHARRRRNIQNVEPVFHIHREDAGTRGHISAYHVYRCLRTMREVLSIRIDAETKKRLDALAQRLKRSRSFLAAEAVTAYVKAEQAKRRKNKAES